MLRPSVCVRVCVLANTANRCSAGLVCAHVRFVSRGACGQAAGLPLVGHSGEQQNAWGGFCVTGKVELCWACLVGPQPRVKLATRGSAVRMVVPTMEFFVRHAALISASYFVLELPVVGLRR